MSEQPLPGEYAWGYVRQRFISAVADSPDDADRDPGARPLTGNVIFKPDTAYRTTVSDPIPTYVGTNAVQAAVVDGELMDGTDVGIWLLTGAYSVEFALNGITIPGFNILVTESHTLASPLWLSEAAPYTPPAGVPVTTLVVPTGAADGQVLVWENGFLTWGDVEGGGGDASDEGIAALVEDGDSVTHAALVALFGSSSNIVVLDYGQAVPDPPAPGAFYVRVTEPSGNFSPAITTQPQSASAVVGSNVTFTAAATGSPTPTAQWQTNTGSGWSDVSGQTGNSLTVSSVTLGQTGHQWRIVYTNSEGTVTSNAATLTVTEAPVEPPVVTTQPTSQSVQEGTAATFTANATGYDSAQWQINTGSSWGDISGATGNSYTTAATTLAQSGHLYRCGFTNSGGTIYTNAATLTVTEVVVEPTLLFSDDFARTDETPIASPWILDAGSASLVGGQLLLNSSGWNRIAVGNYGPHVRINGTFVVETNLTSNLGMYIGRDPVDPVTYPGVKVSNPNPLTFSVRDATESFGTSLATTTGLNTAVGDGTYGGELGISWDGTSLRVYFNDVLTDTLTLPGITSLMSPNAALVGVCGNGGEPWTSFEVWSL